MVMIGNFRLSSSLILAPMAGISSLPFRVLNRKFGCECAFLEMINARSLYYSSKRTQEMMKTWPGDQPLGIQLLGKDPYYILKALEKLQNYKFDILDFNAACPKKKIVNKGEGASLLKAPRKLRGLLRTIVKHSHVPVMIKMRLGWETAFSAADIALYVQEAGVQAICIHGRTKVQGYSDRVNYEAIRKVKEQVSVPVIASGDIFTARLAKKMFDETGCDAVAVARGALGNPWIFKEIDEFLKKGKESERPDINEIVSTMKAHLDLEVDFYGESAGVMKFRKFFIWYTSGFSKIKPLRSKVTGVKTRERMSRIIEEFRVMSNGVKS